jgi:hypothetical protein
LYSINHFDSIDVVFYWLWQAGSSKVNFEKAFSIYLRSQQVWDRLSLKTMEKRNNIQDWVEMHQGKPSQM